jgi:hypothetical protein
MIQDFYALLKQFVKDYPNNLECKRLNGFAVVESFQDLSSPSLSITDRERYKDTYFSRNWNAANSNPSETLMSYPALIIREDDINIITKLIHGKPREINQYRLEILVIDLFNADCKDANDYCKNRSISEIYQDTLSLFSEFKKFCYKLKISNNKLSFNEPLDKEDLIKTRSLIESYNKEMRVQRFNGTATKAYGNWTDNFIITFEDCNNTLELGNNPTNIGTDGIKL